ncbi:MAG: hypothetical protein U9Q08_04595 [Candidatus Omnitrophota bacterium]|nr:hypothetical protein [Candidatus Omnitrophota bacterium]
MGVFRKYFLLVILFCVLSMFLPQEAQSWRRHGPKPKPAVRRHRNQLRHKKYNYIRAHDYNHDGRVDLKDRLLWLRNKGNYSVVHVEEDNKDLVEIIDINEDGVVKTWELKEFYNKYDLDRNGILEDEEISAVTD